jgi:hypothetical protein
LAIATCGDGACVVADKENCESCPADCGCEATQSCVNLACCTSDCAGKECGDDGCGISCGPCALGETCESGSCVSIEKCGDGKCVAGDDENCASCPSDCGCEATQSCVNLACCTSDCGGKQCGDNGCDGVCGICLDGTSCEAGTCIKIKTCGDGKCVAGDDENCASCPSDCGCEEEASCISGACCTPDCGGKQCGDNGCGGLCGACPNGTSCEAGTCIKIKTCGDGKCVAGDDENCVICPSDCGCTAPEKCVESGECVKDDSGCLGIELKCVGSNQISYCVEIDGEATVNQVKCPQKAPFCVEKEPAECVECIDNIGCPENQECVNNGCQGDGGPVCNSDEAETIKNNSTFSMVMVQCVMEAKTEDFVDCVNAVAQITKQCGICIIGLAKCGASECKEPCSVKPSPKECLGCLIKNCKTQIVQCIG